MPLVRIEMLEGRTDEMKVKMIQEVTKAISYSLEIDEVEVDIIIHEVNRNHWATGGVNWDR